MAMSTNKMIRTMDNKMLLYHVNKIRREQEHKRQYGNYGTGNYVSNSEFWRGHVGTLRDEVARRKRLGLIRKTAVPVRRQNRPSGFLPFGGL